MTNAAWQMGDMLVTRADGLGGDELDGLSVAGRQDRMIE